MKLLSAIGLFAVIVGLCAPSAEGTSIFISYIEASQVCSGSVTDLNFSGTVPLTYSTTCVPTTGATIGVSAEGSLSTVRLALDTTGPSQNTGATVRTRDTITAAGGTGSGILVFRWAIDGSLAADDRFLTQFYVTDVAGSPVADYRACGQNAIGLPCFSPIANVAVHDTVTASVPFAFGSPVIVDWSFGALIDCTFVNSPCSAATGTGTNAVHFFNTAQLLPLVVLDSNGNQVSGASVLSDSGYSYAIAAEAAVPEPASLLLLGTGLAVAGVRRRMLNKRG